MSQEEQEQQEEPHQQWTSMKMTFGGIKQSFWTWGFLSCIAQRFYLNWSLTLLFYIILYYIILIFFLFSIEKKKSGRVNIFFFNSKNEIQTSECHFLAMRSFVRPDLYFPIEKLKSGRVQIFLFSIEN